MSESDATGSLGNVLFLQGRLADARHQYERALVLCREVGNRMGEAGALHNLALVLDEGGETVPAEQRLLECLALCDEIHHRHLAAASYLVLGSLRAESGDWAGGRVSLIAARDLAAAIGATSEETLARCYLACLPGGEQADALAAFAGCENRLRNEQCLDARRLLWKSTGDRTHLKEAKRLLDDALAHAPPDCRESMLANVRLNREIAAAAREAGL